LVAVDWFEIRKSVNFQNLDAILTDFSISNRPKLAAVDWFEI
jgi:hypothetical protein